MPISQPLDFLAYSFPSGLILLITAFVGYLGFLGARASQGLKRSGIVVGWLMLMAVAGGSRIYVGISYPSDVAAGFLIGGVWLIICVMATKALEHYKLS